MSARSSQPTGWVGWIYFASLMMMLLGGFQIIAGLVGIFSDDFYAAGPNAVVVFNTSAWGWIHLVLGITVLLAGLAVLNGAVWARILAVFLASLSLFANMAWMPAYPLWSILMIVV